MHQTFSGASRRPRQVNLSGRPKVSNPFAPSAPAGIHNALQTAQHERELRQKERNKLNAVNVIQRSWRGYRSRKTLAAERRLSWDERELQSAEPGVPPTPERCRPYSTESEAFSQLDLLLRFYRRSNREDGLRVRLFLARLALFSRISGDAPTGGTWPRAYLRLQQTILETILRDLGQNPTVFEDEILLQGLVVSIEKSLDATAQHAARLYRHLGEICKIISKQPSEHGLLSKYTIQASLAPLKDMTASRLPAYEAFATEFLTLSELSKAPMAPEWLGKLADEINYKLLAKVLASNLMPQIQGQQKKFSNPRSRANLLAYFIYFYRTGHQFEKYSSFASDEDYMMVVSTLLNSVATYSGAKKFSSFFEEADQNPFSFDSDEGDDAFIQEQINSLADSDSINGFLGGKRAPSYSRSGLKIDEHAEHIASFALTLLRFFPHKGDEIRIRLYMASGGTDPARPSEKLPAIRYFWKAARATHVFSDITKDADAVIPLLKPRKSMSQSEDSREGSSHGLAELQDSWRVILVFMELYIFVLKLMDDEEFFSHAESLRRSNTTWSWAGQSALPLDEVKLLTVFLKNLGFVLYFHAASISNDHGRHRDSGSISSYFNPSQPYVPDPNDTRPSEICIAGIPGIGVEYVKGLVTGLLRMLYERDSRRPFLPKDHWLMTSRFDMTSFIPSVVEEEEKRHRIQENDDDDDQEPDLGGGLSGHGARTVHMQRLQRQQRHISRMRQMQAVAPRLEILQNMPFFIPFETRVHIFREFVSLDKANRVREAGSPINPMWRMVGLTDLDPRRSHHARIRRDHIIDDAYNQFGPLGEGLKDPIQITFVDSFNQDEAGIDGGGVTKEFLTSITKEMFTPSEQLQLFAENEQHLQFPNPAALDEYKEILKLQSHPEGSEEYRHGITVFLSRYEFLGRIIGKCLYEGILVDVAFAGFFLMKWALTGGRGWARRESGYRSSINDLRELDEGLYQGLLKLKNYPGDVSDFSLDFTISDTFTIDFETHKTKTVTRDLKPGGAHIPVTNANRLVYISYVARHRLQEQAYLQTGAFLKGLSTMIQPSWLNMFNQAELQTLIGGSSSSIDLADLRAHTQYGGTYVIGDDGREHPTVQMFWRVMEGWGEQERRALLKFVTSTPRAPLLGFGALRPMFSIRDSGGDQTRLPSTSTCVNLLKLPMYSSLEVLREKLLTAIFSGAGFDLS